MFNSKEIARKALLRACEITSQKKRKKKRRKIVASIIGMCAVICAVIIINMRPYMDDYFDFGDNEIPLGVFEFPPDNEPECFCIFEIAMWDTEDIQDTEDTRATVDISNTSISSKKAAIMRELEKGRHRATLIIRPDEPDGDIVEFNFDLIVK